MTTTFRRAGFPHVELPDTLAAEIEAYVRAGWFGSEAEVVRVAVTELIQRHRVELLERFMREGHRVGAYRLRQRRWARTAEASGREVESRAAGLELRYDCVVAVSLNRCIVNAPASTSGCQR